MKLQYLGDSKDSCTWDYHDYLTDALGFELLNILLMMTPDDNTNEGKTKPDRFPARREIIKFTDDFARIKERLLAVFPEMHVTAVFWHQLMFVLIGKSEKPLDKVRQLNSKYSERYPVEII